MRIAILMLAALCAYSAELDKLTFIAGCWAGQGLFEMWMKPEGGSILGISRTIRKSQTVETEFFHVSEGKDGVVLNVQLKLATQTTPFRAKIITANSVTFENPEHDFPQRIIYTRDGDNLTGRIEGTQNGKERAIDYPMRRASCN